MNKKIIHGLTFLWFIILAVLFVISSTNLVFNENEIKVYNIALILDHGSEEYFENYRAGMDKALKTDNIELDTYVLEEPASVLQQVQLIEEAYNSGAEAVIVKPLDDELFQEELEKQSVTVPVICLDANIDSEKVVLNIYGDNDERGSLLAKQIEKNFKNEKMNIYAFGDMKDSKKQVELFESLNEYMNQAGYSVRSYYLSDEKLITEQMDTIIEEEGSAVFVALDVRTLEHMSEKLEKSGRKDSLLYGFGITTTILKQLEEEQIKAININHEYYMGWQSLQCAIRILEGESIGKQLLTENYTVEAADIFSKEYEDVLFPLN